MPNFFIIKGEKCDLKIAKDVLSLIWKKRTSNQMKNPNGGEGRDPSFSVLSKTKYSRRETRTLGGGGIN